MTAPAETGDDAAGCARARKAERAAVGRPGLAELLDDEAHVAGCAECTRALAGYRRMTAAIGELSGTARRRGDHVARALAAAAATATIAGTKTPPPPAGWRRTTRLAAPLLAMAAGLALVWWLRQIGRAHV
jgi:hypothetical protein